MRHLGVEWSFDTFSRSCKRCKVSMQKLRRATSFGKRRASKTSIETCHTTPHDASTNSHAPSSSICTTPHPLETIKSGQLYSPNWANETAERSDGPGRAGHVTPHNQDSAQDQLTAEQTIDADYPSDFAKSFSHSASPKVSPGRDDTRSVVSATDSSQESVQDSLYDHDTRSEMGDSVVSGVSDASTFYPDELLLSLEQSIEDCVEGEASTELTCEDCNLSEASTQASVQHYGTHHACGSSCDCHTSGPPSINKRQVFPRSPAHTPEPADPHALKQQIKAQDYTRRALESNRVGDYSGMIKMVKRSFKNHPQTALNNPDLLFITAYHQSVGDMATTIQMCSSLIRCESVPRYLKTQSMEQLQHYQIMLDVHVPKIPKSLVWRMESLQCELRIWLEGGGGTSPQQTPAHIQRKLFKYNLLRHKLAEAVQVLQQLGTLIEVAHRELDVPLIKRIQNHMQSRRMTPAKHNAFQSKIMQQQKDMQLSVVTIDC